MSTIEWAVRVVYPDGLIGYAQSCEDEAGATSIIEAFRKTGWIGERLKSAEVVWHEVSDWHTGPYETPEEQWGVQYKSVFDDRVYVEEYPKDEVKAKLTYIKELRWRGGQAYPDAVIVTRYGASWRVVEAPDE